MVEVRKAILHVLDAGSGVSSFSQKQLDLADDAIFDYVTKQIEKAAENTGLHSGELIGVENEFRVKLGQYERELLNFERFANWVGEEVWQVFTTSDRGDSADLLIAEYVENGRRMLAILKCALRTGYAHTVEPGEDGTPVCRIVRRTDALPAPTQKAEEIALVEIVGGKVSFLEKPRMIDGQDSPLFTKNLLKCTSQASAGETVQIIRAIAETVAQTYGEDPTAAVARAKSTIAERVERDDTLAPFDLGGEVFAGREEMEEEFRRQVSAAGVPQQVAVPKKLAVRTARNQKIKTDTGIEITFPLDYAENTDYLEFVRHEDGRISIEIKNVGSIENKG